MSYMDQSVSSSTHPSSKRDLEYPSDGSDEYEQLSPPYKRSRESPESKSVMDKIGAIIKVSFPIPEQYVGLVIGRNGVEVQSISQRSGCRVQVNVEPSKTGFRLVEIYGNPENIEMAKELINEVVSRAASRQHAPLSFPVAQAQPKGPQTAEAQNVTIEIPIPANKCGSIIGKGGDTMRKLRSWSNCHIQLIQESKVPDTTKPLRITGDRKGVEHAQRLVADILNNLDETPPASLMAGNGPVATMSLQVKVPYLTAGAIMGLQGKNVKKLSEETGTKIQFLPDDDPKLLERSLVIIGNRNKVYVAAQMIKEIVEAHNESAKTSVSLFYMSIPASKCGLVIGRGGETIKQINTESGAHCELSRDPNTNPNEKIFLIRGSENQVEHAKHLIRVKVGDIPPNTPYVPISMRQQQLPVTAVTQPNMQMWAGQPIIQQQPPQVHPQLHPHPQLHLQQQQPMTVHAPQAVFPPQQLYQSPPAYQQIQPPGDWQRMQASQIQQYGSTPVAMPLAQPVYQAQPHSVQSASPAETAPSLYAQYAVQAAAQIAEQHAEKQRVPQATMQPSQPSQTSMQSKSSSVKQEEGEKEGEADYSEQWLQYYITIGDQAAADAVRERIAVMKAEKAKKTAAVERSSESRQHDYY